MSQVIGTRPLHELDLGDDFRPYPDAFPIFSAVGVSAISALEKRSDGGPQVLISRLEHFHFYSEQDRAAKCGFS